jgi:hypothetical protein
MEARPRKRTGYMRGEMRSGGECARASEMPATAANVNAAAMKAAAATAEAATAPTVEAAAATAEAATAPTVEATAAAVKTAATAAMASAASRAGIRRGGQQHRASERRNA